MRRLRPERRLSLSRRPDGELPFAEDAEATGGPLLLDTTVYVDVLQAREPAIVDLLLRTRTCNHLATCIAELSHMLGRFDPAHPNTRKAARAIRSLIEDMRPHRIHAPGPAIWCEAGIVAGLLFRLGHYAPGQENRCLNDALIYLEARRQGMTVLTRNIADFDLIDQLARGGRLLLYRVV